MKKFIFIILILLFATGCNAQYNLTIKGNKISEEINGVVDKSKFISSEIEPDMSIYSRETLDYMLLNDIYPINNNFTEKYEKTVVDNGNIAEINLKYTYVEDTFKDSYIINSCFEHVDIIETKRAIYIKLTGEFTCLSSDNSSMPFVVSTTNKVVKNNADRASMTTYEWEITSRNKDDVSIEITVLKQSLYFYYGVRIAIGIVILGFAIFIFSVTTKIRNRDEFNEV